ncbi:MAG: site-specific DNA recombinase [Desulforhopalus sp.]|jgi:site-specific DNA recombinase
MYENSHPALVSEEVGQAISELKKKGKQANRFNQKRTYVLSGLLKCGDCGYSYIGDRTTYRCNAQTKAGSGCTNNGISIKNIEDAIFSYLHQQILASDSVTELVKETQKKMEKGNPEIEYVADRLENIESGIDKLLDLYQSGLINKDMFATKVAPMNEQKKLVGETLEQLTGTQDIVNVSAKDILYSIAHLSEEMSHADPIVVKSAVHSMIDEIVVNPRRANQERSIQVKGSYLPLT